MSQTGPVYNSVAVYKNSSAAGALVGLNGPKSGWCLASFRPSIIVHLVCTQLCGMCGSLMMYVVLPGDRA